MRGQSLVIALFIWVLFMIYRENSLFHLIFSRGISSLSGVFSSFVLNLWVFDKTDSYQIFLISTFIVSISPLLFSIPAGIASDKFRKSQVLVSCDILSSIALFIIMYIMWLDNLDYIFYFLSVGILSVANEFRYTAMTSIIPEMAKKEMLIKYNGIQQFFRGASIVLGPILGYLSYFFLNAGYVFFISILIHVYSIFIIMIFISKHDSSLSKYSKEISFLSYKDVLLWVLDKKHLRSFLFIFAFFNAALTSYMSISTPYFLSSFDKVTLTVVVVLQGAGLILSSLFLLKVVIINLRLYFFLSMLFIGGSIIGITFSSKLFIFPISFLIGFCVGVIGAINQSIWQKHTPNNMQGRVIALRTFFLYIISPVFVYAIIPISDSYLKYYLNDKNEIMECIILSIGIFITLISILFFFKSRGTKNDYD